MPLFIYKKSQLDEYKRDFKTIGMWMKWMDKKLRQHYTTCMIDGKLVDKEKKAYNTLDEAIKEARRMNCMEKVIHKVVAYKCGICFKYHVGRSHKELQQKDRLKYRNLSCY